jgi:hypothetical protein
MGWCNRLLNRDSHFDSFIRYQTPPNNTYTRSGLALFRLADVAQWFTE